MKTIVQIVLFIFVIHLLTPTIVSLIEDETDISIYFDASEEEKDSLKEIKAIFNFNTSGNDVLASNLKSSLILSENSSKLDSISSNIIIPPPKKA